MGGENVRKRLIIELSKLISKLNFNKKIKSLTDSRNKYEIPLSHIFYLVLYSSIIKENNFLAMDKLAREIFMKKFIKSKRPMIASDDTINLNLSHNIRTNQLADLNYTLAKDNKNLFKNQKLNKVCGIIDGTEMSGFMKEVLLIPGKIDFILDYSTIPKRGKELPASEDLMKNTAKIFGNKLFNLILADGLYYSANSFRYCKEYLSSCLFVKTEEKLALVKDAEFYIKSGLCRVKKGYDNERQCSYTVTVVDHMEANTIKEKLQFAIIKEEYSKKEKSDEFYVITNDLTLNPDELQYAAHLRWRIENNGFKSLNRQFNTKTRSISNETCFNNLLWIIIIAYNLYNLFLMTLDLKEIFKTEKITRISIASKLRDSLVICFSSELINSS
jgi:hypothetical protein